MRIKKIIFFTKLLLFVLIALIIINFISGYFSERVKLYIKQKATLEASSIIAETIEDEVLPEIDLEALFKTTKTGEKIDTIFVNTYQVNSILSKTTSSITNKLNNLENEDLENISLPLGIILSDVLFADLGPNINIKLMPVGAVKTEVISSVEEYGINNSIFKLEIRVTINFDVIIPLQRETIEVISNIPLVVQIIQGDVPRYFFSSPNGGYIPVIPGE